MYLNLLNENEQNNFLQLALYIANYDNDFNQEERDIIDAYKMEMALYDDEYDVQEKSFNEIMKGFDETKQNVKNALLIEIMALVMADKKYDEKEIEIMTKIKEHWNISEDKYSDIRNWVLDMQELYSRANELIES